jgi:hypothetical protein
MEEKISLEKCLTFLETDQDHRPKGIIMDPTRHVFDSLVDLLAWHDHVKESIQQLISNMLEASRKGESESSIAEEYSGLLSNLMYPLLVEGTDIVEAFETIRGVAGQLKLDSKCCVQELDGKKYEEGVHRWLDVLGAHDDCQFASVVFDSLHCRGCFLLFMAVKK